LGSGIENKVLTISQHFWLLQPL
jgi:hypothetical protein